MNTRRTGQLAEQAGNLGLPLPVLHSSAGYYIGTFSNGPISRESVQYWDLEEEAQQALSDRSWTQRTHV